MGSYAKFNWDTIPTPKTVWGPWHLYGNLGFDLTGNGLVNWASGGRSTVSWRVYGKLRMRYEEKHMLWESNLSLDYAAQWINQDYDKYQGQTDKIDLNSKFGYEMSKKVYASAYFSFLSQLAPSYNYSNNAGPDFIRGKFFAPAYIDLGLGFDYNPYDWLSVYFSPLTCRMTVVAVSRGENNHFARVARRADEEASKEKGYPVHDYAVYYEGQGGDEVWGLEKELKDKYDVWNYANDGRRDYSKNVKADAGFMIRANASYVWRDLKLSTMLELFTPYRWDKRPVYYTVVDGFRHYWINPTKQEILEKDMSWQGFYDNNRRFFNFDVRWELSASYRFLKVMQVTLYSDLRYVNGLRIGATKNGEAKKEPEEGHEAVQWHCTFGLGIGYSF